MLFTDAWKLSNVDGWNCPNRASVFAVALIAVKYVSHVGNGLPSSSTKSPRDTPIAHLSGTACVSAAISMFVISRAIPSVMPITSAISDVPFQFPTRGRFRNITTGTCPRRCSSTSSTT